MKTCTLPDPGEGLLEAEIVHWLVRPGQAVAGSGRSGLGRVLIGSLVR